jgi:hypothetical protein
MISPHRSDDVEPTSADVSDTRSILTNDTKQSGLDDAGMLNGCIFPFWDETVTTFTVDGYPNLNFSEFWLFFPAMHPGFGAFAGIKPGSLPSFFPAR